MLLRSFQNLKNIENHHKIQNMHLFLELKVYLKACLNVSTHARYPRCQDSMVRFLV